MHGIIPAEAQRAIFPVAQECTEKSIAAQSCSDVSCDGWFANLAKRLWPKKTAAALEYLTGAKERVCHYWVAGREPQASVLVTLLRSEEGGRVFEHVMRGCRAAWWIKQRRDLALAAVAERFHRELEQQLELKFD